MFVDRTECLLPCGCRMECTECYCSHVCQQNSVHLCLLTKRSLCWCLSWQKGAFMFANHKCVCSCLPRGESVCSCLSRQRSGCSCVCCLLREQSVCIYVCQQICVCSCLFAKRVECIYVCQQISACLCLPREQSVHSCLSKNSMCTCFSREQGLCLSEEQNACLSRECSVCSVLLRYPSLV